MSTEIAPMNQWALLPSTMAEQLSFGQWHRARHLDVLAKRLVASVTKGGRRLLIQMPPRHGKSEMVSHWFPVWYLNTFPARRVILVAYNNEFAEDWGRAVRNSILENSDLLRVRVAESPQTAHHWNTTAGGGMTAVGIDGTLTGRGANLLIIDDPIKGEAEAQSQTWRDRVAEMWRSTIYTRIEPGGTAIVTMTRWHEDDLVGRLIAESQVGGDTWDKVCLPAIAESGDLLGRKEGEPLWPERFGLEELAQRRRNVGSRVWNALYQQRPAPAEGGLFKREWWRFRRVVPARFDGLIQSWDLAFKETASSDFVVGQVWGRAGADRYLLDQVRARMDFPKTIEAIRRLSAKWPTAHTKLIEDKANGPAVIASLRKEIPGLIAVEPQGGKVVRANAVTPLVEAGNVYLPDPALNPWVRDLLEELATFPNGPHDDQVDALSQALVRLNVRPWSFSSPQPGRQLSFREMVERSRKRERQMPLTVTGVGGSAFDL